MKPTMDDDWPAEEIPTVPRNSPDFKQGKGGTGSNPHDAPPAVRLIPKKIPLKGRR